MKYLAIIFSSFVLFHYCSDSVIEPNEYSYKRLKGQLQNYNLGDSVEIRLDRIYIIRPTGDSIIVISSGAIEPDGSFEIELEEPPDFLLNNISGCSTNIISDSSALIYPHSSYILYKNDIKIGFIYCSEKSFDEYPAGGEYITSLLYSNKELTVTGDCIYQGGTKTSIYKINCHYLKGWNFRVHLLVENSDTLFINETIVNNTFKGNWYFGLYD